MAKAARQDSALGVVPGVVSDAAIQVIDNPDLRGSRNQVKDETRREGLRQPRIAALRLRATPDDDPSDGKQADANEQGEDGLRGWRLSVGHEGSGSSSLRP